MNKRDGWIDISLRSRLIVGVFYLVDFSFDLLLMIIMVNLPPPINDPNILEDEHALASEHAPIAPNPAPIQPNDYLVEEEGDPEEKLEKEEEPVPEQAPAAPDDEEEEEAEAEDEEEMDAEEDEDMEIEDNEDENDAEIIQPYKEVNPLNRPPPSPETAEQEFMNAPVSQSTLQPLPPIWQFAGTFYVGQGSSATVLNLTLSKVYAPGPMINDLRSLYAMVKTLTNQMWDRYKVESSSSKRLEKNDMRMDSFDDDLTALDSTLRKQIQEMKKIKLRAAEEKVEYKLIEVEYYKNHFARVSWHYNDLSGWEYEIRDRLPLKRRYKERPYDPSTNTTFRPQRDDSYVMVRDNAVRADAASDRAAIRAERERVRGEGTRAGGPAAAPVARKCTFIGFMKCGPTQFYGTECAVRLCHWFERMESNFEISECPERRKLKFATATHHGRAFTWWNSQEVQRLEDELRHLKLRDTNIAAYTKRFNELVILCPDAVSNEKKKLELYIKGLPEVIKGEITSFGPTMLNEAVRMAHTLMEQKIQAKNERIAKSNKRRWE
nr:hypothetical protein [Tanacetum cinerariifolium]